MATKTGIEPLSLQGLYLPTGAAVAGEKTQEAHSKEIQVLARRLSSGSSTCVALMSLDCDDEIYSIAQQVGQEWAKRTEHKVCVAGLPVNAPEVPITAAVEARTSLLTAVPGQVVEFSYRQESVAEMQKTTANLSRWFDHLLVALPSPLLKSDGMCIVRECQSVVLVVKAGVTRRGVVQHVVRDIEAAGGTVSGVVLYDRRYPIPEWLYKRI